MSRHHMEERCVWSESVVGDIDRGICAEGSIRIDLHSWEEVVAQTTQWEEDVTMEQVVKTSVYRYI